MSTMSSNFQGSRGPVGFPGFTGRKGADGSKNGPPGFTGATGPRGGTGGTGPQGVRGPPGRDWRPPRPLPGGPGNDIGNVAGRRKECASQKVLGKISTLGFFITLKSHDDVIKWKHFPRYWPFVRGIHRWPVNSPHKGQWRGAFMFVWSAPWINGWVNNRKAGDLRRHRAHYNVILMHIKRHTF